jgi:hypothetical protein
MKIDYIIFLSILLCSCDAQKKNYEIDRTIENDLEINKDADEMSGVGSRNVAYFLFSSKEMERKSKDEEFQNINIKQFVDTANILIPHVCGCQLKNDTITIGGGIFYGGGIGYLMKMTKNRFDGKILIASNSETLKKQRTAELESELYVASIKQDIKFYEEPKFELGSVLKGKIILTSDKYYTKSPDGLNENQSYMKVLFDCELSEYIGF